MIDSFADLLNGADVADMALRDIQVTIVLMMMTILKPMTKTVTQRYLNKSEELVEIVFVLVQQP